MPQPDLESRFQRLAKLVAFGVGAVVVLTFVFGSYYTVQQGTMAVQTRFGSIAQVTGPGLHFKVPWVDDVAVVSTRTTSLEWHRQDKGDSRMEAYSHDQQAALMSVKLSYHVKGEIQSVRDLYSQFRNASNLEDTVIIPRVAQGVKTTFGQFTAASVIQNRVAFNDAAAKAVEGLVNAGIEGIRTPIVIDGINIYDIKFSDAYEHAVEQRMQAEVEVQKVIQNLERTRKEAEMKVVEAEANAKAVTLRGNAEANAIRARSDALRDSPKLVELTAAEKWDGHLPTTMVPGSALPFIHVAGARGGP
ncbi:MAG TPA: prohibitin family protein [Anaeromyxobacteraceae bacterium]|nr:prohibitin family protein [Anaeromyxobacteraceae bacterium]